MSEDLQDAVDQPTPVRAPSLKVDLSRDYLDEIKELREESKNHRLKAKELEQHIAEAEKTNLKKIAEYEDKMSKIQQSARLQVALAELKALAIKEGIVDPDDLRVVDPATLKLDEDGQLTNATEVLDALKASKPHFFGSKQTTSSTKPPAPAKPEVTDAMALGDKEWAAFKKKNSL